MAGAILPAKTNVPEFAYWTETDNLLTRLTNNPWNLDRTPGGSSGGESAAIAAGLSPIGPGSGVAISLRGPGAPAEALPAAQIEDKRAQPAAASPLSRAAALH